jgi:hypothetical protein
MSKNVMRLLDRSLGLMECKVCGRRHFAGLIDGSHYVRDAWLCQNGCELKGPRARGTDEVVVRLRPV